MSDLVYDVPELPEDTETNDLEALRSQCKLLGIKYHHKHSAEKLAEMINEHHEKLNPKPKTSSKMTEGQIRAQKRKEALLLKRVMITCNDPMKIKYPGEIFQAANEIVGTVKKYCPFGNTNGWYMPKFLLNSIEERVFRRQNTDEHDPMSGGLAKAYNIVYLGDLSAKELEDLKQQQAMIKARFGNN